MLIVYYSRSGNTRVVAEKIHATLDGSIVELQTVHPYPEEYRATTEQAQKELKANYFPLLKTKGQHGWLLDGFPRNMVQAEKLWDALKKEGLRLDYVVEILLPREVAKNRIMGRRLCKNNNNHPNNIFIEAIKPAGDVCRVCGGELSSRSDDQDESAINKRHDIYYNDKDGTLAAAYFFKDIATQGKTKYIELNGEGSIDSIKETLLSKLA